LSIVRYQLFTPKRTEHMVEKEIFVVVIFMVTLDNMLDGIRVIDDKGWPENEAYTDNIPILVAELYKKT